MRYVDTLQAAAATAAQILRWWNLTRRAVETRLAASYNKMDFLRRRGKLRLYSPMGGVNAGGASADWHARHVERSETSPTVMSYSSLKSE